MEELLPRKGESLVANIAALLHRFDLVDDFELVRIHRMDAPVVGCRDNVLPGARQAADAIACDPLVRRLAAVQLHSEQPSPVVADQYQVLRGKADRLQGAPAQGHRRYQPPGIQFEYFQSEVAADAG